MTIEESLKEYILSKYKSIRTFVQEADLPYTTMDGILKRGIHNASINNVLKICKTLNISADELANGRIIPVQEAEQTDLVQMLTIMRHDSDMNLSIDGDPLSPSERSLLIDCLDVIIEMIRKRRKG